MIAYKTPFEIYVARKRNALRENRLQDEILPNAGRLCLTKNDRNQRSRQALKSQKQTKKPRADVTGECNGENFA